MQTQSSTLPSPAHRRPRHRLNRHRGLIAGAALSALAAPVLVTIGNADAAGTTTAAGAPSTAAAAAAATTTTGTTTASGWKLKMADEFSSMSTANWSVRNQSTNSNEKSYLTSSNVTIDNGSLRIQGKKQSMGGRSYTSGYVNSASKQALPNYFRVEIRAKVPLEMGMWAAPMWFRPTNNSGGEIDLLETYGADKQKFGSYHYHHTVHNAYGSGHQTNQKQGNIPGDPLGWHTYTIEKTAGQIAMFVDGKLTGTWKQGDPSWFNSIFESGKSWRMIMNLQIGGARGNPDSTTNWAADKTAVLIDHVYTWTK